MDSKSEWPCLVTYLKEKHHFGDTLFALSPSWNQFTSLCPGELIPKPCVPLETWGFEWSLFMSGTSRDRSGPGAEGVFCFFILLAADDIYPGHPWCKVPVEPRLPSLASSCSPFPHHPRPFAALSMPHKHRIHLFCFCLVNIFKAAECAAAGPSIWNGTIHILDVIHISVYLLQ